MKKNISEETVGRILRKEEYVMVEQPGSLHLESQWKIFREKILRKKNIQSPLKPVTS